MAVSFLHDARGHVYANVFVEWYVITNVQLNNILPLPRYLAKLTNERTPAKVRLRNAKDFEPLERDVKN